MKTNEEVKDTGWLKKYIECNPNYLETIAHTLNELSSGMYRSYRNTHLLIEAVKSQEINTVNLLIASPEIPINVTDDYNQSALWIAVENQNVEIVKLLLAHPDIDVNLRSNDSVSPLEIAIVKNSIDIVNMLLAHPKIDPNTENKECRSPLHVAVNLERAEIVKALLAHSAIRVNSQDKHKNTPLHIALLDPQPYHDIIQSLLAHKEININIENMNNKTARMCAEEKSMMNLIADLNSAETANHNKATDDDIEHAIAAANDLVRLLGNFEAQYGWREKWFPHKHLKILKDAKTLSHEELAVNFAGFVNAFPNNSTDKQGEKLLLDAVENGMYRLVSSLLNFKNMNPNAMSMRYNMTALHRAIFNDYFHITEILLKHEKIDVNIQDGEGRTPLLVATKCKNEAIVKILLANKRVNPNIGNKYKETALMYADQYQGTSILDEILKRDDLDINATDTCNETALHIFSKFCSIKYFKLLLKQQHIDVNIKNDKGRTALHIATEAGRIEHMVALLQHKNIDINIKDAKALTALDYAKGNKCNTPDLLKEFINHIDVHACKVNGISLFIDALKQESTKTLETILNSPNFDIKKADENGRSPMILAIQQKVVQLSNLRLLLTQPEIDVNATDIFGDTALHILALLYEPFNFEAILKRHTDLSHTLDAYTKRRADENSMFSELLKHEQIDVNKVDASNQTVLQRAASRGDINKVIALLAHPKINVSHQDQNTPNAYELAKIKKQPLIANLIKSHQDKAKSCHTDSTLLFSNSNSNQPHKNMTNKHKKND